MKIPVLGQKLTAYKIIKKNPSNIKFCGNEFTLNDDQSCTILVKHIIARVVRDFNDNEAVAKFYQTRSRFGD
jgi:hypothetical protein